MSTTPVRSNAGRWIFWAFLAIAAFYLLTEHRAHVAGALGWLPFGLLLLCPLMHVFMHGRHAVHGGQGHDRDSAAGSTRPLPGTPNRTDRGTPATSDSSTHGGH